VLWHRGEVDPAVERSIAIRSDATCAARVSILPLPIMRVTEAEADTSAMIPTPNTTTATSASTSVKPELACFMATLRVTEGRIGAALGAYPIAAIFIE